MIIKREQNKQKNVKTLKMTIDILTLDILCRYILSNSSLLRMNHLVNLQKLIYHLDASTYENDPDKIKRIKFLKKGIEARINYNLNDRQLILNHILTGLEFEVDFIDFNNLDLSSDELQWAHNMVAESIQYSFVYEATDRMLDLCTRIKTSDYSRRGELIHEFESMVDEMKNEFRKSKVDDNMIDMTFSLMNGKFERAITDTWNLITNSSRRLICGMQGLNEMTGGGFESGRVYMLLGTTGIGKSISLLNLVYQMKRYNKHYIPKDPTKTPAIVLLTMENTVVETITRLFDLATESTYGMANYEVNDVINKLRTEGELVLNDDSPIDIVIKYKANKSVDTSYLYTLVDDLEDEGYEVICMVQDHVKRIRSIYNSSDIRIELGDIVNEFKVFAAEKDIPVITNSHLNRDAAKIIEEGSQRSSPTDITMKLGKSNVGESLLMMDNIDCAIIINLDFDQDNNKYMVYSLIKMRDKTERTYIAQPFLYGSGIRMVEDVGGVPMFKDSLHMNSQVPRIASVRTTSSNIMSNINNIVTSNSSPIDTSFINNSSYSLKLDDDEMSEIPQIPKPPVVDAIYFIENPVNKPSITDLNELRSRLELNKARTIVEPIYFESAM